MKKTIIICGLLAFVFSSISYVMAAEYVKYSSHFIKKFKNCDAYVEDVSSTYDSDVFNEKREIIGWKNGFCHYRSTIKSSKSGYLLDCMFSDVQVDELYKAMKSSYKTVEEYSLDILVPAKDPKTGQTSYKKIGATPIKGNKAYIVWTKYQNNPYFCRPQKIQ